MFLCISFIVFYNGLSCHVTLAVCQLYPLTLLQTKIDQKSDYFNSECFQIGEVLITTLSENIKIAPF